MTDTTRNQRNPGKRLTEEKATAETKPMSVLSKTAALTSGMQAPPNPGDFAVRSGLSKPVYEIEAPKIGRTQACTQRYIADQECGWKRGGAHAAKREKPRRARLGRQPVARGLREHPESEPSSQQLGEAFEDREEND